MSPAELRACMNRLGVTTGPLARLLGIDHRSAQRYLSGERQIPEPICRLLWIYEEFPEVREAMECA